MMDPLDDQENLNKLDTMGMLNFLNRFPEDCSNAIMTAEQISFSKLKDLRNPKLLTEIEEQESRNRHDETYGLLFEITKRKRMFVVITYKTNDNKIYIVTAYPSTKRVEKLIKRPKIRG